MKKNCIYLLAAVAGLSLSLPGTAKTVQTLQLPTLFDVLWKKVEQEKNNDLPKSVIETLKTIEQAAREGDNNDVLLKAINERIEQEQFIYTADFYAQAPDFEQQATKAKNPIEQAFLYAKAADFYRTYYFQNRWRIDSRPEINAESSDSIDNWNRLRFMNTIVAVSEKSFFNESLKTESTKNYSELLKSAAYTAAQCPTLYDFFVRCSIERLKNSSDRWRYTTPDTVMQEKIIALYDELIKFNRGQKEEGAMIYNEVDKLEYLRSVSKLTNEEFLISIAQLEKEFSDSRYITVILLSQINYYMEAGGEKVMEEGMGQAYRIAKEALSNYKGYPEIDKIEARLKQITLPFLHGSIEKYYPDEDISFEISRRNIDSVVVAFYRITESPLTFVDNRYNQTDSLLPSARLAKQTVFGIKENLPYRAVTDTIHLPSLTTGLYQYKVTAYNSDTTLLQYRILPVSGLTSLSRRFNNGDPNFWVVTSKEGKPVNGAEVVLYEQDYNNDSLTEIKRTVTDKMGLCADSLKLDTRRRYYYRMCFKDDTVSLPQLLSSYWNRGDYQQQKYETLFLYTDRSVYRPGETVWFKGILIEKSTGEDRVLAARKVSVALRNPTGKTISEIELTTNEYGSVEGSFRLPDNDDDGNGYYALASNYGQVGFHVEHYKRPNFEVLLAETDRGYLAGDEVTLEGMGKTYSSVSLQNAYYRYTVTAQSFDYARIYPPIYRSKETIATGEGNVDKSGNFTIRFQSLPADTGTYNTSQQYIISGYMTDIRGETQTFEKTVTVGKKRFFLNAADMPELIDKEKGLTLTLKGANINNKEIEVKGNLELLQIKGRKDTVLVREIAFTGGKEIKTENTKSLPSGRYLLRAKGISVFGDMAEWQRSIILYGMKDKHPPIDTVLWVVQSNTELAQDKEVLIVVGTTKKTLYLLYELFGKVGLLERRLLELSNGNKEIRIPYTTALAEGGSVLLNTLYESNLLTKTIWLTPPITVEKPVITWETWRKQLYPGDNDTVTLRITGQEKGLEAEVLATMYDASLEAIAPHVWRMNQPSELPLVPMPLFNRNYYFHSSVYMAEGMGAYFYSGEGIAMNMVMDEKDVSVARSSALAPAIPMGDLEANPIAYDEATPGEAINENSVRKDFAPTAFFYPVLRSDADGKLSFSFKMPQSLTRWKMMVLASTKSGAMGQSSQTVITQKELMVTPLLPRFIREGDSLLIRVAVNNLLEEEQNVVVSCEFFNPSTNETLFEQSEAIILPPSGEYVFASPLALESYTGNLRCRFKATGTHHADGVEQEIPVLPSYITIKEGESIELKAGGRQSFAVSSPTGMPKQVDIEVCNNLIAYVVKAIPELAVPQTDDAVSWMASYYTASIAGYLLSVYPDLADAVKERTFSEPNRINYLKERSLEQLRKLQTPNGGWSWFDRMPSSIPITIRILKSMAQLYEMTAIKQAGEEDIMLKNALDYLDKWGASSYKEIKDKSKYRLSTTELEYLYVRSLYNNIPISEEAQEAVRFYTALAQSQWQKKPLNEKVMTALLMQSEEDRATWDKVTRSIGEYPLPANVSDATLLLRFYASLGKETDRVDELIRFILRNKKSNVWRSGTETMDALFALCKYNPNKTSRGGSFTIEKEGHTLLNRHVVQPMVVNSFSFAATQLGDKGEKIEFINNSDATLWIGAIRRFDEQLADARPYANGISVERQYYKATPGEKGDILTPLTESDAVSVGDKIVVRLKVSTPEERSYMRLRDYFPANLENEKSLSGSRYYEGSWVYETQNDQYKSFYLEQLQKGTTLFEYTLFAAFEGNCRGGYAEVESTFAEEFGGHTGSVAVKITKNICGRFFYSEH